jgi:hypothetical protein
VCYSAAVKDSSADDVDIIMGGVHIYCGGIMGISKTIRLDNIRQTYRFSVLIEGELQNVTKEEVDAILITEVNYSARVAAGVKTFKCGGQPANLVAPVSDIAIGGKPNG